MFRLVGVFFVVLGVVCVAMSALIWVRAGEPLGWPTVSGHVVEATVETRRSFASGRSGRTSYRPRVVYEYVVGGRTYSSRQLAVVGHRFPTEAEARVFLDGHYPVGSRPTVHYDPADPSRAVLEVERHSTFSLALGAAGHALTVLVGFSPGTRR